MSSKVVGIVVTPLGDGASYSGKIKKYETYEELVNDPNSGKYGIVDNVVYHKTDDGWVVGFPNIVDEHDYTSFKVYAHDTDIEPGVHDILGEVTESIPASMTHKQTIRTMGKSIDSDIVVDWGDGAFSSIRNGDYDSFTEPYDEWNDSKCVIGHTYEKTGSYTVKIFGRKYYGLRTPTSSDGIDGVHNFNLIYEALSENCKLASNVKNLSDFLRNAARLTRLKMSLGILKGVGNIYALCRDCVNLISATGFPTFESCSAGYIFLNDINLKTTDFVVPAIPTSKTDGAVGRCFEGCIKLENTVESTLPQTGFTSQRVNINQLYMGCESMTLGDYTNVSFILWGNNQITFCGSGSLKSNTASVFTGCSDELRAQIPTSWGGTNTDI